jgi:hypothetical protein
VERYQRIMAEEVLYAREFTSEDARSAAIALRGTRRFRWCDAALTSIIDGCAM